MSPKRLKLIRKVAEIAKIWGVQLSDSPVCEGHTCTAEIFTAMFVDRLSLILIHGPRGGGKSLMAALDSHLNSLANPNYGTKILGGSMSQSGQIYEALRAFDRSRPNRSPFTSFTRTKATYFNGSETEILAASPTSVRGPHVPSLKLDEVDEIEDDIREQAAGIAMARNGVPSSVAMLSTWHRVSGAMSKLIKKAEEGLFPYYKFCIWETTERCPEERSGKNLEGCEKCDIKKWCHSDRHLREDKLPKAKRSNGHYKIDDLIQKVHLTSTRIFESDFLCERPRSSGLWFVDFDRKIHVTEEAEYDRSRNFHVSIDPGVHTGVVWFQSRASNDGYAAEVNVFGDYYSLEVAAGENAEEVIKKTHELCGMGTQHAKVSMDPAGNARTGVGPTMKGEYERMGCKGKNGRLTAWPIGAAQPKVDGLVFIEALLKTASGKSYIKIHPRCTHLISAFENYARAIRDGQLMDFAEDPAHPQEDLIDALAGGLKVEFPKGRAPKPQLNEVHASKVH